MNSVCSSIIELQFLCDLTRRIDFYGSASELLHRKRGCRLQLAVGGSPVAGGIIAIGNLKFASCKSHSLKESVDSKELIAVIVRLAVRYF